MNMTLHPFELEYCAKEKKPNQTKKPQKPQHQTKKPPNNQIFESTGENERKQNNQVRRSVLVSSCPVAEKTKHLSVK